MSRGSKKPEPRRRAPKQHHAEENRTPRIITDASELSSVCDQISSVHSFAFDTEFIMEDRFKPEIGLIQLATDDTVVLVDPYEVEDLSPVWNLVADPSIEVVVHAGIEDLSLCFTQGGVMPQNVFDCQVACGMITTDYPLSLARMTRNLIKVRLHKSQTLTDWRRRPLSPEQIRYAADDVIYLPSVRRAIQRRSEALKRTDWIAEEMSKFSRPETYERTDRATVVRLKGAGSLDGLGLAVAIELIKVREQLASQYDRPVRSVIRDHLLVEIARHRWTKPSDIKKLRGMNVNSSALRDVASGVERACALPEESWPPVAPVDDESDQEAALAMLLGAVLRAHCNQQNVSHQLVAAKAEIRKFVRSRIRNEESTGQVALDNGWRHAFAGARLDDVISGKRQIQIIDGDIKIPE
ncbi:MAG: ribonuclease D [Phycisphaerae bacterium]|nr:MAG: ribonuclease D [Phycisphaerae bacterium]